MSYFVVNETDKERKIPNISGLEPQERKNYTTVVKTAINTIGHVHSHEFLKSFLIVEAKIKTPSDVVPKFLYVHEILKTFKAYLLKN